MIDDGSGGFVDFMIDGSMFVLKIDGYGKGNITARSVDWPMTAAVVVNLLVIAARTHGARRIETQAFAPSLRANSAKAYVLARLRCGGFFFHISWWTSE